MIVALKENGKVDGVTKATETRRSKGDQRQFLLLPLLCLYFQIACGDWLEARILVLFLA